MLLLDMLIINTIALNAYSKLTLATCLGTGDPGVSCCGVGVVSGRTQKHGRVDVCQAPA